MHSKAKAPTKEERRRNDAVVNLGCVCCFMDAHDAAATRAVAERAPVTLHHLNEDGIVGKRRGNADTVGACPWHHQAIPPDGMTLDEATATLGPSWGNDKRGFRAHYGSNDELLAYQESLLKQAGFKYKKTVRPLW